MSSSVNIYYELNKAAPPEIKWKFGKLDKKYECCYCNSYLKSPVVFECKHRTCAKCFNDLINSGAGCPTCGRQIPKDKVMSDQELQKEILNLPVFCSFNLNGCKWEESLKNLPVHLDDCEYALVECQRGCGQRYQRRNERKHVSEDCMKNDVSCDFCKEKVPKSEEADHLEECTKFPIPCPAKCNVAEMPRDQMQNHLDNECTKYEVPCPFSECQCSFKSLRGDMAKHLKDSPGLHLNLMCKTIQIQKKQMTILSEIVEKQKEQLVMLSTKVDSLEKFYGSQLIWKIDNFAEKYNDSKNGKKPTIFSPPFLTSRHGYKLALSTTLHGDGKAKGKYMSLFICICKGEFDSLLTWPFNHKITFSLLDQCPTVESRRHVSYTVKPNTCKENMPFLGKPTGERNASFGAQKFVELEILQSLDYITDDAIFIKVEIDSENMIAL